jgi:intein/homing endonuclease
LISCEGIHLKNVPANFKNPRYVINPDLKSLRHVSCPFFLPTNTVGMQSICSFCQRVRKAVSNFKINEKKRLNRSTRTQLALKNSRIVQKRARRLKLKNKEIIQELKEVRKKMMNIEKGDILAKIDRLVNMTPAQRLLIEECISFVSAKEKLLDDIRRNGYYFAYLYISKGLQATIFYV